MIYIAHRKNTIDELIETDLKYGVEIDLRSHNGNIILHHDPMSVGEDFDNWLRYYNHNFLILNVKEEGLETSIVKYLYKYKIENYFFLDQSIPFLIKHSKLCNRQSAARVSEYESIESALRLKNFANWIWLDQFNKFPVNPSEFEILKANKFRICLVSPELQARNDNSEIIAIVNTLKQNNLKLDAICSKKCELWEKLLYE